MGGCKSKPEVNRAVFAHPSTIAGSTVINSDSVMILDGKFLMPVSDSQSGESSVIEVDMRNRRVQVIRGVEGRMTNAFINSTRRKKRFDKAFADVKSDDSDGFDSDHERREMSFNL